MIFWSSAEISPEVNDAYRNLRKSAEAEINELLRTVDLTAAWEGWEWVFIAIIISPALGVDYPERIRRDQKGKVLEFRLKIDFEEFAGTATARQADLVFEQLHRSVNLMAKWKMSEVDREKLHEILEKTHSAMVSGS